MAIPDFEGGFLPIGPPAGPIDLRDENGSPVEIDTFQGWTTDVAELHDRLVMKIGGTSTRYALYHEFAQMLGELNRHIRCALVLVSGGFVTEETDPTDLHMGVVVQPQALAQLSGTDFWRLSRLFEDNEVFFGNGYTITTELVALYPVGHVRYPDTVGALASMRHKCGHPLGDSRTAGYVQLVQCEGGGPDAEFFAFLAGTTTAT